MSLVKEQAKTADETGPPVRVVVVDDQVTFLRAARAVVTRVPGFELVGEAGDGTEAVDLVSRLLPDLVLMDINMAGMDGIEATTRIRRDHPGTVVYLVSTYRQEDLPARARTCGADGYLHKDELSPWTVRQAWDSRDEQPSVLHEGN
jgi:two-component system, NarL family, invasion response regulator UvrY